MARQRICIDGFNLSLPKGSGIATYARNLNLAQHGLGHETQVLYGPTQRLGRNNLLNEIALRDAAPQASSSSLSQHARSLLSALGRRAVKVAASGEVLAPQTGLSVDTTWACRDVFHTANRTFARTKRFTSVAFQGGGAPDLMHWTCALPLHTRRAANVYTIHDVVPLRLPHTTLDNKVRFHSLCRRICREADHVVTVSETTRQDIIRLFNIHESRITNTSQAVNLPPALVDRPQEEVASDVEALFGLQWRRYFLFFGAVEPKKNLARIIEAYLASGVTDPLVIIGGQAWLAEAETRLLYEDLISVESVTDNVIRRADRVRRYDYLPLPSLVSLIRGAKATLFPSLYEGFGLPVLESMLLGTPVLTSTAGSLPEVAGDAALMVDPYDVHAIKRGIQALDSDEGLRRELAAKGKVQSTRFSPEAVQGRLGELYQRLL